MAQRMGKSLIEKGIGVDFVIGVDQYQDIPAIISSEFEDPFKVDMDSTQIYHQFLPKHQSKTCGFITIMRGCNNFCSYCIVPYVRGRER
ncbi:MAG TPA: tRNA (N6-isopentenyl adenosine(37)-C2)-methylthiotransferase MiaB, partial [Candidatus Cloacimonadota bacterium]|nr:tRNA (N6-isopentenyl adenosine(37)-C2)-methylthiotransferase MiaB [Candidatus Cloacimonadota bacterium]